MADIEPTVTLKIVRYVEIRYGHQVLVMPADESADLLKPLAALLPDDLGDKQ